MEINPNSKKKAYRLVVFIGESDLGYLDSYFLSESMPSRKNVIVRVPPQVEVSAGWSGPGCTNNNLTAWRLVHFIDECDAEHQAHGNDAGKKGEEAPFIRLG